MSFHNLIIISSLVDGSVESQVIVFNDLLVGRFRGERAINGYIVGCVVVS